MWRKRFVIGISALLVIFLLFTDSIWPSDSGMHTMLDYIGYILILTCVVGRTWCSMYIGGKKKSSLIMIGPYSVSRNPLYFFSVVGSVGIGFQAGNISTGALIGLFVYAIFSVVIGQEEKYLIERFGEDFIHYCESTPRWLPKLSGWSDVSTLNIQVELVKTTFRDALWFVAAIPLLEAIKYAQKRDILPTLLQLP